jgi:hypothetical protein
MEPELPKRHRVSVRDNQNGITVDMRCDCGWSETGQSTEDEAFNVAEHHIRLKHYDGIIYYKGIDVYI